MKPLSIRLQLSLMVSLLTLVVITVLSIAAYIEFKSSMLDNIDATLMTIGEGIRAELNDETPTHTEVELRALVGHGSPAYSSLCRLWVEGDDKDMFTSGSARDPLARSLRQPPAGERPDVGRFSLFDITGDTASDTEPMLRVLWMRHVSDERIVNILVARSSSHVYHDLREFLQLLLASGGAVTLIVLLLVPRIISWGLRSISQAGRQLELITHRSLADEGRAMDDVPVELRPFKSALDGMLVRLNDAMRQQEQLTADVAHELRTPLAIMKSTLQILRMQPRSAAQYEEGVDDALQDINRMEQLVRQLLTLARLDAADEVPDPAEVRLDVLLESVAEAFGGYARQRGASVVCANDKAVRVLGNETELRQLFNNLLDNALRYGPPNGVVRITLKNGPAPWATACVHDEGGAIPPEHLPHLFDRFHRVDLSRSQAYGGTGLGLAIARRIVQQHHGDITITSDRQTGTSVVVQLPRL